MTLPNHLRLLLAASLMFALTPQGLVANEQGGDDTDSPFGRESSFDLSSDDDGYRCKPFPEESELFKKVKTGDFATVEKFLASFEGDINEQSPILKLTALHVAAEQGALDIAQLLVAHKAEPRLEHLIGWRAIDTAREYRKESVYHWLNRLENPLFLDKGPFVCGNAETRGHRDKMEDTHTVYFNEAERTIMLGVYDGHGGHGAARFAQAELANTILATEEFRQGNYSAALIKGFEQTDRTFCERNGEDSQIGTTAVTALIKDSSLFLAWVGDARGVVSRGGRVVLETKDHKPVDEEERINKNGGKVILNRVINRVNWVNGSLAVSRAIGDAYLKKVGVIGTPEIRETRLDGTEEFVLLACDGLWDVMDNQAAVDFIHGKIRERGKTLAELTALDAEGLAEALVGQALALGSSDNVTVNLLFFRKS